MPAPRTSIKRQASLTGTPTSGLFPLALDESPHSPNKKRKTSFTASTVPSVDSQGWLWGRLGIYIPALRRKIKPASGLPMEVRGKVEESGRPNGIIDGAIVNGAGAGAEVSPRRRRKDKGKGRAREPLQLAKGPNGVMNGTVDVAVEDGDPVADATGLTGGLEDLSLGVPSRSRSETKNGLYPPLPVIEVDNSTSPEPTKRKDSIGWRDRILRSAAPSPPSATPFPAANGDASPSKDLQRRPSQKRGHILSQDHRRKVSQNRRLTVDAARQPVGRRALQTPSGSVSTPSASTSQVASAFSARRTPSGSTEAGDNSYTSYLARVQAIYNKFDLKQPETSKGPQQRDESLDAIFRKAKLSKDSPLPPRASLTEYERLARREKALDKSFTKPRPRLRRIRAHLNEAEKAVVRKALATPGEVASLPGALVEGRDIQRLQPGKWLNDEIATFYGVMIMRRAEDTEKAGGEEELKKRGLLKVHCFSSFFMPTYDRGGGHKGVKRWTKKTDLFSKDIIIFPLNLGNTHWVLAAANLRQKRFEYYDSMGGQNPVMLQKLRTYLHDEHVAKKGGEIDFDSWEDYYDDELPQQDNGSDCGVFVCQFMECLSRSHKGAPAVFDFTAKNMPYMRQKMIYELATKQLLPEEWAN